MKVGSIALGNWRREKESRKNFTVFLKRDHHIGHSCQMFLQGNLAFPSCWSGDLPAFCAWIAHREAFDTRGKALLTPLHPPHAQGGKPQIMDSKIDGGH